jgi:hypothetical protein
VENGYSSHPQKKDFFANFTWFGFKKLTFQNINFYSSKAEEVHSQAWNVETW